LLVFLQHVTLVYLIQRLLKLARFLTTYNSSLLNTTFTESLLVFLQHITVVNISLLNTTFTETLLVFLQHVTLVYLIQRLLKLCSFSYNM